MKNRIERYNDFVAGIDQDLVSPMGKEHYRLLSYVSTMFNDNNLFDIGTHYGYSAFALSYNDTNRIQTFDIINEVTNPTVKDRHNINFNICDLFVEKGMKMWSPVLLDSPLIFLDVDPHNGIMEKSFYDYLFDHKYQGVLLCDDIHYFEGMKNNFWSKIPDEYKIDLTSYGHWSGTGAVSFNKTHQDIVNYLS